VKSTVFPFIVAVSLSLACSAVGETVTKGIEQKPFVPELKAGDYIWKPEISPAGPVVMIVSLPEQTLYVYRNGVRIGRSTISSGKPGHRTPTGVFTILEKNVNHTSSMYKGASMPYMERLTWGGVAVHAGNLPGYPASHGCVRLPLDFAEKLYTVTSKGTTVIVTDGKAAPSTTSRPGLLFQVQPEERRPVRVPVVSRGRRKRPQAALFRLFSAARTNAPMYTAMAWRSDARLSGKWTRAARLAVTLIRRLPRRIATVATNGARSPVLTARTHPISKSWPKALSSRPSFLHG
jgi:hypothetical protein